MAIERSEHDQLAPHPYNHARYKTRRRFSRFLLRNIGFTLFGKIHQVDGIENIPTSGPAILMINHIAFIDPFVVINVSPRTIVPMAKIEVYDYPIVGIFPKLYRVIPVRRQEVDRRAIRMALEVLQAGEIILIAPEGTRGPHLSRGKEGVAYIASRSGAPVVPVAIDGTEGFPALRFTSPWKNPGAYVHFGRPFYFRPELKRSKDELRLMTDEAMYILAAMLPPEHRGVYSDLSSATQEPIHFI